MANPDKRLDDLRMRLEDEITRLMHTISPQAFNAYLAYAASQRVVAPKVGNDKDTFESELEALEDLSSSLENEMTRSRLMAAIAHRIQDRLDKCKHDHEATKKELDETKESLKVTDGWLKTHQNMVEKYNGLTRWGKLKFAFSDVPLHMLLTQ